jgi:hypothetical protein
MAFLRCRGSRRIFGSGDCPNMLLVLNKLKIGAELQGLRYHKPQSPWFAIAQTRGSDPGRTNVQDPNPLGEPVS